MRGLIIRPGSVDLIMRGQKNIVVQGSNPPALGEKIYLLEERTHKILATAILDDSILITKEFWEKSQDRHLHDETYEELKQWFYTPYAWVIKDVTQVQNIYYRPSASNKSLIWVKNVTPVKGVC